MCLRIIFTSCLCDSFVLQPLLIIIEPWFQSFVISSSPTSIVLVAASSSTVFLYFQNRTCTETPLQVEVYEIIFPMSHRTHETGSEQESCAYLLRRCNLSKADFRLRSTQYFCHISLYGSSKLMILDDLERIFEGYFGY
jgi:hypothetical protein